MEGHLHLNFLFNMGSPPDCSRVRNSWRIFNHVETQKGDHKQPDHLRHIRSHWTCFFRISHHQGESGYRQATTCFNGRVECFRVILGCYLSLVWSSCNSEESMEIQEILVEIKGVSVFSIQLEQVERGYHGRFGVKNQVSFVDKQEKRVDR